jgi:UDP-3-O-[3-hydroxymyristoyl] N-acetylglucosamine deacetylase
VKQGLVFQASGFACAGGHSRITVTAVTDTRLASTISNGGAKVYTVEHLMSACAGSGIDNMYVDITPKKYRFWMGLHSSFAFLLQSAGIVEQNCA